MTVDEIFKELSAHMIEGLMLHTQIADYYDFLALRGYKRCHEYHAHREMQALRKFNSYFINHYNKLVKEKKVDSPNFIPETWYNHVRQDVDNGTKRSAVKTAFEKWVLWEKNTKKMYETMYKELLALNEVAAANKLNYYLCDVTHELKCAERKHLELLAVDFSLDYIMDEQGKIHDFYKSKMKGA